jgi:hypothetical protein
MKKLIAMFMICVLSAAFLGCYKEKTPVPLPTKKQETDEPLLQGRGSGFPELRNREGK